jgi:hypothetical protein
MVVFQNVVFKNDNGCDNNNGVISVELPIKQQQAQRLYRPNVLVRLSKRLSNLSHSTTPISLPEPPILVSPPSSSFERQNSSESDLSLSKLDITDEYSGIGRTGNESSNTSLQASEIDLAARISASSYSTSQRFTESFRNFYSRLSQKRPGTKINISSNTITTNPSTTDSNTRLTRNFSPSNRNSIFEHNPFSCCFRTRTNHSESLSDVTTPHHRSFLF